VAVASARNHLHPHPHLIAQFLRGWLLFLTPNQQCQSTKDTMQDMQGVACVVKTSFICSAIVTQYQHVTNGQRTDTRRLHIRGDVAILFDCLLSVRKLGKQSMISDRLPKLGNLYISQVKYKSEKKLENFF